MGKLRINGREYDIPDGCSVSVVNGEVRINGQKWDEYQQPAAVKVEVVGSVNVLHATGSVDVNGDVGAYVKADGSATVGGSVKGSVTAGGSVQAGDVGGDVSAGGSVHCGEVGGRVSAGVAHDPAPEQVMTRSQKESLEELRSSAWYVGWSFGFEGADTVKMLASVGEEIGCAPEKWLARLLLAGHAEGGRDRREDARIPEELIPARVRIVGELPL